MLHAAQKSNDKTMRYRCNNYRVFAAIGLAASFISNIASADFVEVTGVSASANGWDTRASGDGCSPSGCIPSNVFDGSVMEASRWSCNAEVSGIDACELTVDFDEPQDLVRLKMALYEGDERIRSVNVWVDGVFTHTITSSGTTTGFETYDLIAPGANTVVLQGVDDSEWLSITEVTFMIDDSLSIVTGVSASANGYDARDNGNGCPPSGCLPDNVLDDSIAEDSRWSCNADSSGIDACELTLMFDEPQDIVQMYMALHEGDERTRSLNVWVDGVLEETITSSGTARGYEAYDLVIYEATTVVLQAVDIEDNGWLSITGVRFVTGEVSTTSTTSTSTTLPTTSTSTSITTSTTSECPSGSIPNTLDISMEFVEGTYALRLWVEEPSTDIISLQIRLGESGISSVYDEDGFYGGTEIQNYLLLNGLSTDEDPVLGDYDVYVRTVGMSSEDDEPIPYTLIARSGGKVLWTEEGTSPDFGERSESHIITISEYADSDCSLERYGECPPDTFSATGAPPCEKCPGDSHSDYGATFCTVDALDSLDVPLFINNAILEDAPYGFAGYGYIDVHEDQVIVIEGGELEATGTVILFDDTGDLPDSIALYYYVYNDLDESSTDYTTGQGTVDPSTGVYSATISVPDGKSRVILSFVVLDEADTVAGSTNTAYALEVFNNVCDESYLTFTLEWDNDANLDLAVFETDGTELAPGMHGNVGYMSVDDMDGFGPETYKLYNGLSVDQQDVLGEYRAMIWFGSGDSTTWTLTARVAGEVAWVETGELPGDDYTTGLFYLTINDYVSYEDC